MDEFSQFKAKQEIATFVSAIKQELENDNIKLEKLYADLMVYGEKRVRVVIAEDGSIKMEDLE